MKVTYKDTLSERIVTRDLSSFAKLQIELLGNCYVDGAVEKAHRYANSNATVLGNLIDLLASRKQLSAEDITDILGINQDIKLEP